MRTYSKPLLIILIFQVALQAYGQIQRTPEQDSIIRHTNQLSQLDHQLLLKQLGIEKLRPGVNGNDLSAPNAVNYDESKANPYPEYPNPLLLKNGQKVQSQEDWWEKRRPEILEDFDREVYGRFPAKIPPVNWILLDSKTEEIGGIPVITKTLLGKVDNSSYPEIEVNIELTLTTPTNAQKGVPIILQFGFKWPEWFPRRPETEIPEWQLLQLKDGWGFADMKTGSIQVDNGAGLTEGIIGLVNKGEIRKPEDWGTLKAWAWGASRALDYFETDEHVDAGKVGVFGHSRFGKAAAVALAYDTRFAIGYISSSGAGGLKPHRRNYGEVVENVASWGEYHWMGGNYVKYAGPLGWDDLPVDAHELIALCAPRPVFIGCGNKGDEWVDPKGMFLAGHEAGKVYNLLGYKGLNTNIYPTIENGIMEGNIAFRQHNEGHTPNPNWKYFIQFAKKYF